MGTHNKAVASIAQAVKGFYSRGEPFRVFHGSTNSTRPRHSASQPIVDISALNNVLHIDRKSQTVLVEPNVPMDKLVEATLAHSLIPPVVMEFPGITAGGGFAGTSGESSSFRHGFFDSIVEEVEMVLGNGDVVTANRDNEHADLFRGAAGAVGSLGLITLLKIRLMPAKTYVALTYHRTTSVAEAVARIRAETEDDQNDYIDGILFSKDHGAIITGRLTDDKPPERPVQTFSRPRDPWFYQHVQSQTQTRSPPSEPPDARAVTDYIPLAEYLFRYDRAGFWVGAGAFDYFKCVPFNKLTRWLLDDFLHTRMLYRALHASGSSTPFVVQDIAFPYDTAERFVDYAASELGIWPLWLCPLRRTAMPTFHPVTAEPLAGRTTFAPESTTAGAAAPAPVMSRPMLNIGLWGWGPRKHADFVRKNRALEDKTLELRGRKWLYAHTYYPEQQFWDIYGPDASEGDHEVRTDTSESHHEVRGGEKKKNWYHALREKYHAEGLPSAWQKVRINPEVERQRHGGWKGVWPLGGLYGIWKAAASGDIRLHQQAGWKYTGGR